MFIVFSSFTLNTTYVVSFSLLREFIFFKKKDIIWNGYYLHFTNEDIKVQLSHSGGFPDSSVGKESTCKVRKICWRRDRLPTPVFLGSAGKESICNAGDLGDPWVRKIPWRRQRLPTPVFWAGEFHKQSIEWQRVIVALKLRKKSSLTGLHFQGSLYCVWIHSCICPLILKEISNHLRIAPVHLNIL